jgi:Raf kinase inhibitor-like YbhB/YbcL family protein
MTFALTSAAFAPGREIPRQYTCDGKNASPSLTWSSAPSGARSFALVCDDPDAPGGVWFHWAIHGIPAETGAFPEAFKPGPGIKQGVNDFGRKRYDGPCPPRGHGQHHYRFKLYALSVAALEVKGDVHCCDVERAAHSHALAAAELIGVYERGG